MTLRFTIAICIALLVLPVIPALAANTDARVVVPSRDIARGEIISESDLTLGTAQASQIRSGTITSIADLSGMQARRYLRAGELVLATDVRRPIVITKGETVTMTFDAPGISLTATGRALSEGGIGETVTVLNPVSYRQVMATVTGPGTVRADGAMPLNANPVRTAQMQNN
ncbi:MAG TPA: flagellar basal body P-ring formation chaperone FlgA [Rhizomicrobium sp.]|nr:flagellar basal body P-ring formation chaperone FlgA [Rhizomicrobium sp.]